MTMQKTTGSLVTILLLNLSESTTNTFSHVLTVSSLKAVKWVGWVNGQTLTVSLVTQLLWQQLSVCETDTLRV